jgi:hypothetical protein
MALRRIRRVLLLEVLVRLWNMRKRRRSIVNMRMRRRRLVLVLYHVWRWPHHLHRSSRHRRGERHVRLRL